MVRLLAFLLLITGPGAFAQKYSVEGRVVEKQGSALPSASIVLLQAKDSSVVRYTTTSNEGLFVLPAVKREAYILKASFLGFAPYFQNLTLPAGANTLYLGTIELQPVASELAVVTVIGQKPPVVHKEDTVEYQVGSFLTRPHANAGQLLKKLPGVEVETDGSIRVQGEGVTRILVDGKEFFGGDVQMALRSLPAHVIDRVQVIDGKPEEARFTGIDNGRREKVINLTLKEHWQNTGFGKAKAGVGTANRYVAEANYNRFDKGNQLAVTGMSNNINNQGLSSDKAGGDSPEESGQNGLVKAHGGGINTLKQVSKKTSVNGSYGLNYTNAAILSSLTRQNFLPEGTALYTENNRDQERNSTHQANAGLEHKDPLNLVRLNAVVGFTDALTAGNSRRQSYSVADSLVNEGERSSAVRNNHFTLSSNLLYGRRFGKEGRIISASSHFATSRAAENSRSNSFTWFSQGAEEKEKQWNEQENKALSYSMRLSYTEPLGKKQYLQASYTLSNRAALSDREVYDRLYETSVLNQEQSSRFRTGFLEHQAGLSYQLNRPAYSLAIGTYVQRSELSGMIRFPGDEARRTFQNILPNVSFNRRLNRFTRFNFVYHTLVREPSINQLQPVLSRFDPLHVYIGNPGLRPEYTHQGRLNFNTSVNSGIHVSGSVNFYYTTNPITAAVTLDERQVRTTQYINVRENSSFAAFLNLGVPVKIYHSRFNLSPYLRQGQSINLLNGIAGTANQRSIGGNLGYAYTYEEFVDINLRANINVTDAGYRWNNNQSQVLVTSAYMADATVHFFRHFDFAAEMSYSRFRNTRADFDQAIPVCNFSLSRFLTKDHRGEFKISAHNVLNRKVGAAQFATPNYIEQSTLNALGSFYMASLAFTLNQQ